MENESWKMENTYHTSVLLKETIDLLDVKPGHKYIDATLGGGGHTRAILERGGIVLGIDQDQDAIDFVKINGELKLAQGNFKDIKEIAKGEGFAQVAGVIFDLGVSSHQFDLAERGFSFQKEGPLDMRMDRNINVQAKDLINSLTKAELYELFTKLGEERHARIIAESIVSARKIKPIETTMQLAMVVNQRVHREGKINPATRIFQALRIAINDELNVLREALPQAFELLEAKGRIAVITFHSLEDRIVKSDFNKLTDEGRARLVNKKPITPTDEELQQNKRSRSAKLRVIERI